MQTATAHVLQGTPVWTRLGERVGRVYDVEFEVDTGRMVALHVRQGHWVPLTPTKTLIIAWIQIVEITPEKVVVDDAVVQEQSAVPATSESLGTPVVSTTV